MWKQYLLFIFQRFVKDSFINTFCHNEPFKNIHDPDVAQNWKEFDTAALNVRWVSNWSEMKKDANPPPTPLSNKASKLIRM